MKLMTFPFLALLTIALACNKGDDPGNTPNNPASLKLEGKWILVKTDISLKFDDGSVQNVSLPGSGNDYTELKFVKKDGSEENGTIKNVYMGDESNGTWVYTDGDKSLDITYTSLTPHYFLFRRVQTADEKSLVLTADDEKVLQQYTLNGLNDFGSKKLTGGSIREEWKK